MLHHDVRGSGCVRCPIEKSIEAQSGDRGRGRCIEKLHEWFQRPLVEVCLRHHAEPPYVLSSTYLTAKEKPQRSLNPLLAAGGGICVAD